jgi:hypothetical protein
MEIHLIRDIHPKKMISLIWILPVCKNNPIQSALGHIVLIYFKKESNQHRFELKNGGSIEI